MQNPGNGLQNSSHTKVEFPSVKKEHIIKSQIQLIRACRLSREGAYSSFLGRAALYLAPKVSLSNWYSPSGSFSSRFNVLMKFESCLIDSTCSPRKFDSTKSCILKWITRNDHTSRTHEEFTKRRKVYSEMGQGGCWWGGRGSERGHEGDGKQGRCQRRETWLERRSGNLHWFPITEFLTNQKTPCSSH